MSLRRLWRPGGARSRILVLLLAFATVGCGHDDGPQAAGGQTTGKRPAAQGHGGPGNAQGHGAGAMEQAVPVAVTRAETGPIASFYRATATLEAEKEAQILARVEGVVREILAEEGDRVEKGTPLLRIDNEEYGFRLEQAEAETANLKSRFDRLAQMREQELATDEEFQAARADLAKAEADEGLARLNLSYTTVTAPFDGSVTQRLVDVGQNLKVGDAVFVMADFDPLLARVHVPSREFKKLRRDQQVELVLDSTGQRLAGRIKLVSPVIDPASGTIKLTVEVPEYPAGTRPGDFAQVEIVTERKEGVVLVPREAVVTDKSEQIVFTVAGGDHPTAERRIVEVGFTDDRNAEILTGLSAGETVVIKGQRSLKHGTPLKILEDDSGQAGA